MTQEERRCCLIQYLLKEEIRFRKQKIPKDKQGQENLLRSLMNTRLPKPIPADFLRIQDEYLIERNRERGITDIADLTPVASDPRLYIWQGDITTLKCDAIVNACNSQMLGCFSPMHACIDNFIHTYAGMELRLKMYEIMKKQGHEEETGKTKITSGNIYSSHRRTDHTVGGYRKRGRIAGKLLQRMSQAGGGHGSRVRSFLLSVNGGVSFSTAKGGRNRYRDGKELYQ